MIGTHPSNLGCVQAKGSGDDFRKFHLFLPCLPSNRKQALSLQHQEQTSVI